MAARRGRDTEEAARIGAQAGAYWLPSACGHWRSQTMGADCGLRRPLRPRAADQPIVLLAGLPSLPSPKNRHRERNEAASVLCYIYSTREIML